MKENIPKLIRYSRVSHGCFITCIVIGLYLVESGGILAYLGMLASGTSLWLNFSIFRRLKIGFYWKPPKPAKCVEAGSNQTINAEWEFAEEKDNVRIGENRYIN